MKRQLLTLACCTWAAAAGIALAAEPPAPNLSVQAAQIQTAEDESCRSDADSAPPRSRAEADAPASDDTSAPARSSKDRRQDRNAGTKTGEAKAGQAAPDPVVTVQSKTPPDVTVEIKKAPAAKAPKPRKQTEQGRKIGINAASRMLILYENGKKVRMYHVGVGTPSTPTPPGFYSVQTKEVNPTWIDPSDTTVQIPAGPDNPLGYRWIGFHGTYGIHGTNNPSSVGYYVSNGCVRMHEKDVEELYPLVSIGTPVMVYYDRIVIDSAADHTVSYYIYPDGYGWQPLTVQDVRRALAGYGVENFVTAESIAAKIAASDGQPTYIAKAYDLYVNEKKLPLRALKAHGITYLPAVAVATALRLDLHWDNSRRLLTSPYGSAPGVVRNNVVYVNAAFADRLFHLSGALTGDLIYNMQSQAPPAPKAAVSVTISPTDGPSLKTT
ncbi:L,D-transpeptidase family protein [Megasphaera stantonii]|uniref:L,D-transpeptidase family protein n=1 Tax=Megasphaera stantonii TaxID=2144175 RepID=UPI001D52E7F6|nr:L,D-transpeptidase family protein [Megasphaera stantonii]HJE82690.1 L,D-transpeptidase family protein [Megasphaera stantonii]